MKDIDLYEVPEEKLKPCPFCGSENIGSRYINGGAGGKLSYVVFCEECRGSMISHPSSDIQMTHIDDAKARWNKRVKE